MFRRVSASQRLHTTNAVFATAGVCAARALTYSPRVRDYRFLLEDVFQMYDHYARLKSSGEPVTKELMNALLEESAKLATQSLFPLYESGDREGCKLHPNGTVTTPQGFQEAYKNFIEGGWTGINDPEEYGGQDLPPSVGFATREIVSTANWPFGMYPGLSIGASQTLRTWASDELKKKYLPHLVSGEWSGTMCLTEPQCGTDLSQVKTKAEPQPDGTYRLTGTKIFISAGDHDMVENIIHVVLARLPGSSPTTKGLSLFLCPRNLVKEDGTLEAEKNIKCIAVEKKLGIKANATCQLGFDNSVAYIIGEPNAGMKEMFTFMNAARMGCALEGIAHAELAFQNGLRYARERGSMRALDGAKAPSKPCDPIIFQPSVRHHVLFSKIVAEGGRAFLVDLSRMLDKQVSAADKSAADQLEEEIGFFTPIAKACLTEWGVEAASRCLQIWGGHGYISGNGMEQIYRDARIATIYEGTTEVQAMDFIGRKVLSAKGQRQVKKFGSRVNQLVRPLLWTRAPLGAHARALWYMQKQWRLAIVRIGLAARKETIAAGAASLDLLMYSGHLVMGYYWLRMAIAAQAKVSAGEDHDGFYQTKVDMCHYVFERFVPRASAHHATMFASADMCKLDDRLWDI